MVELRIHQKQSTDLLDLIDEAQYLWIRGCEHDGMPYSTRSMLSAGNPYRHAYNEAIERIVAARNADGRPALRAGGFKLIKP